MVRAFFRKTIAFLLAVALTVTHFFALSFSSAQIAYAAFNPEINYQGLLLDSAGDPVADAGHNIQFKLYTVASGGTAIWTETYCYSPDSGSTCDGTGTDSRVDTTDGLFSVMLGSITSLATVDFNQDLYLGVNIGGTGTTPSYDGEMTPRKQLGTVPAAFVADTIDGIESDQFFRNDIVNATSSATTSLAIVQNGAGKVAEFFGPSYTSIMSLLSTGEVGVGTTTPGTLFSVGDSYGINMDANGGFYASTPSNIYTPIFRIQDTRGDVFSYTGAQNYVEFNVKTGLSDSNASWVGTFGKGDGIGTLALNFNAGATTVGTIGIDASNDFSLAGGDSRDFNFAVGNSANFNITTGASSNISAAAGNVSGSGNLSLLGTTGGTGDTAGLTTSAGDTLSLLTAGTQRLFISSAGNVGVGTSSPYAKLSVVGETVAEYFTATSTTASSTFPLLDVTDIDIAGKLYDGSASAGTNGYVLQTTGTGVSWVATSSLGITGGGSVSIGDAIGSATAGSVLYIDSSGNLAQDNANFYWDTSTNRLGIGTTTPSATFAVAGTSYADLFSMPDTTDANNGIFYVGGNRFLHNQGYANTSLYVGALAGNLSTNGQENTGIGSSALASLTLGAGNTAVGYQAMGNANTRYYNLSLGNYAGYATQGDYNTFVGTFAARYTYGSRNVVLGYNAGDSGFGSTGSNNIFIGYQAGNSNFGSSANNIIIGYDIDIPNSSASNQLSIGNLIYGTGLDGSGTTVSTGNIGVGTSSPYAKLSVVGETVAEYFTATSTTASSTFPLLDVTDIDIAGKLYDGSASAGTNGYVLQTTGTGVSWVATSSLGITGGGSVSIGDAIGSATAGSVLYIDSSGNLAQDNDGFYFDATKNYLNLGTSTDALVIGDITGNTRGADAIDIQSSRSIATQVAGGAQSTALGYRNTVSGLQAIGIGVSNTVSGTGAIGIGISNLGGTYSSAIGYGNNANSTYAFAGGYANTSSGANSVAVGSSNTASGGGSFSFGQSNTNAGGDSLAAGKENTIVGGSYNHAIGFLNYINTNITGYTTVVGNSNDVYADYASIFGFDNFIDSGADYAAVHGYANTVESGVNDAAILGNSNNVTYSQAVAIGYSNTASGQYSIAGGYLSTTNGQYSISLGYNNEAYALGSVAIGYLNAANANYSTAIGSRTLADGEYSSALGYRVRATVAGASVFGGGGNGLSVNMTNATANSTLIGPGATTSIHILGTGEVKLPYLTATSTTASSTFPLLDVTDIDIAGKLYDGSASAGTNGYVLQTTGTGVSWVATSSLGITGGGSVSIGDAIGSGSIGSALFIDEGGLLAQDSANFYWDDLNDRLGIGTSSPYARLSVAGETVAEYFTATSTTASSTFPLLDVTDIDIAGKLYDGSASAGTNGYVLQTTGTGVSWVATSSLGFSTTSPSGSSGQIQFNNSGSFGADSDLTYNSTTNQLTVGTVTNTVGDNSYSLSVSGLSINDDATPAYMSLASDVLSFTSGSSYAKLSADYLNFGSTVGSSGFGVRNNGGVIEYKNSSGVWTSFDSLTSAPSVEVGTVMAYATSSLPDGWLWADGSAVSRTTYAELFSAIGTTFGSGDGSTTFNLPDLRGRTVAGRDNMDNTVGTGGGDAGRLTSGSTAAIDGDTIGASGGEEEHTLTAAEIPTFTKYNSHTTNTNTATGGGGNRVTTLTTTSFGGGQAHNNVQPTLVLDYIIKYEALGSGVTTFSRNGDTLYFTDGSVGIGTTTPSSLLSLGQSADTAAGGLWIAATDGDYRSLYMDTSQVLNFAGGSGNTATLNAVGTWTNASDIAYKENVETLDYGLEEIMLLNPRRYTWKSNGASDIGFIAQELEQVIPEVVFGTDGSKTVAYGQLTSIAIRGLQDFGMRIDVLEAPTSTPSLKLDAEGKLIVNSGFTVQNEASIGSLDVLDTATFNQGITVLGTSTSAFGGALLVEGSVTLGSGDIVISSNGIESAGSFAFNESQFVVATSGAVGIGTSTPDRMLHVVREGEGSPVRFQDANGYCEINPTTASLICTSDQTLKENITELVSASMLDKIRELKPVTFEWISDKSDTERVGFIAQEVEVVIPELVYTDPETGLKSVAYGGFVPYLVSAMKELVTRVDALTEQLQTLSARIEDIAARGYSATTGAFEQLRIGTPARPSGITIYDEETGEPYCLTTKNGSLVTRSGECGTPIEDVTSTTEQHVLEEDGEGSIEVIDGESVNVNELLEINSTSTTPTPQHNTGETIVPDLVPEPESAEDSEETLPELEVVIPIDEGVDDGPIIDAPPPDTPDESVETDAPEPLIN